MRFFLGRTEEGSKTTRSVMNRKGPKTCVMRLGREETMYRKSNTERRHSSVPKNISTVNNLNPEWD